MTTYVNGNDMRARIRTVIDQAPPGFTYKPDGDDGKCKYFHNDGSPSCLIGHVLADLSVVPQDFDGMLDDDAKRQTMSQWNIADARKLLTAMNESSGDVKFSAEAIDVAEELQFHQDHGEPWAQLLERGL